MHILILFFSLLFWSWFLLTIGIAFTSSLATEEMRRVEAKQVRDFCDAYVSSSTSSEFVKCESAEHHLQTFQAFWLLVLQRTIEVVAQDTLRIVLANLTNGFVFVVVSLVMVYGVISALHVGRTYRKDAQWRDYSRLVTDVEFGSKKFL